MIDTLPSSCPPPSPSSSIRSFLSRLLAALKTSFVRFASTPPQKINPLELEGGVSRRIEGTPEAEEAEAGMEEILEDGDIFFEAIDALRDRATTIFRRSLVTCPSGFWINLLGPSSTSSTEDIVYPVYIVSWFVFCVYDVNIVRGRRGCS